MGVERLKGENLLGLPLTTVCILLVIWNPTPSFLFLHHQLQPVPAALGNQLRLPRVLRNSHMRSVTQQLSSAKTLGEETPATSREDGRLCTHTCGTGSRRTSWICNFEDIAAQPDGTQHHTVPQDSLGCYREQEYHQQQKQNLVL